MAALNSALRCEKAKSECPHNSHTTTLDCHYDCSICFGITRLVVQRSDVMERLHNHGALSWASKDGYTVNQPYIQNYAGQSYGFERGTA